MSLFHFSAAAQNCAPTINSSSDPCTLTSSQVSVEAGGSIIGSDGDRGDSGSNANNRDRDGEAGSDGGHAITVDGSNNVLNFTSNVSPALRGGKGGQGGSGAAVANENGGEGGAGGLGGAGVLNDGLISTLTNASLVTGGIGGSGGRGGNYSNQSGRGGRGQVGGKGGSAIYNENAKVISTFNNSNQITGGAGGRGGSGGNSFGGYQGGAGGSGGQGGEGIFNTGTIGVLTNTGKILGGAGGSAGSGGSGSSSGVIGSAGAQGIGINNTRTITTLNNQQGESSPLTYTGTLPINYNIMIASTTLFGKLSATAVAGSTNFGVSSLTTTDTSILNTTFASVLTGISALNLSVTGGTTTTIDGVTTISATSNGYSFTLSMTGPTTNIWDLILTACSICGATSSVSSDSQTGDNFGNSAGNAPTPISSGTSTSLSSIGTTSTPVLAGGSLLLGRGERSNQAIFVQAQGGAIVAPITGAAQLSGILSGTGKLTFSGSGITVVSGINTYTGGTTVDSGTLSLLGGSLGTGDVYVAAGAQLMGTGSIAGPVRVAGLFKPGNSPGYISAGANITMVSGSVYQQDIAGTTQASASSPVGATGYYSHVNITGGQFIIGSGVTLTPALSNLFNELEPGFGSAPYTPQLGDRFRIVTADGGISGKFSNVTQPAELAASTQFLPFYNMDGANSLDLAVIPKSYASTIAFNAGNKNAQSVGSALDNMVVATQAGVASSAQDQLLYVISTLTAESLPAYVQSLAGEVYAAAVAVMAQTTQRIQQAVYGRLDNTKTVALSANGKVWGDMAYQKVNRRSDSDSGGWNSNLYQLVFGSDADVTTGLRLGGGIALSNTTLNPIYGSGKIKQGSVFVYGKQSVEAYVVDAIVSVGLSSSDLSRSDVTKLSNGYRSKTIAGFDTLMSLGISRPIDLEGVRLTPYVRATWQMVNQSGVNEGSMASALSVDRFTGNGVRGVLGVALSSKDADPMSQKYTYRAYVGLGLDSPGLLNPTINASIAGMGTNITTPQAGATFVQAGLYATAKVSSNVHAYAGLSGEARSGQVIGAANVGIKIAF